MYRPLMVILACGLLSGISLAKADGLATRFGNLTIGSDNVLLFRGKPVVPKVDGNNSLTLVKNFTVGPSDVTLVQDNGGTACPTLYYFLTSTPQGATSTRSFGTCADLIKLSRDGNSIIVIMGGYRGPFESSAAQARAAKEKHVFIFANGLLTEKGRVQR
jgi:hypothetical protein